MTRAGLNPRFHFHRAAPRRPRVYGGSPACQMSSDRTRVQTSDWTRVTCWRCLKRGGLR